MFIGEFKHNLDQKGRLAIPAKFRAALSGGAVVTRGIDRCLFLYSQKDWQELAERLVKLPLNQSNARAFARLMLAGATDVQIDQQGRILIPDYLRSYAVLGKKAIVAGLYNRLEIWEESAWNRYKAETEKDAGNIAEKLGELGI